MIHTFGILLIPLLPVESAVFLSRSTGNHPSTVHPTVYVRMTMRLQRWRHPTFKGLHIKKKQLHGSQIFKVALALVLQLLVKGRGKSGNLLELVGQVGHTAVMHPV